MAIEISVRIESEQSALLTTTLTTTLLQQGFKLSKYRREITDQPQQSLVIFSTLDNQVDFNKLKAILSRINGVLNVTKVDLQVDKQEIDTPSQPRIATQSAEVEALAKSLAMVYPNIIASVMEFSAPLAPTARATQLYQLGEATGRLIFTTKFKNYQIKGSLTTAFSKLVLPILKQISIADVKQTQIVVSLSPFALNQHSSTPQCHFITGLIAGLLNSPSDATPVKVTELLCHAQGHQHCVFNATAT